MARCARRPHASGRARLDQASPPAVRAVRAMAASPSIHKADAPAGNAITHVVVPGALIDERAGRQRLVGPSQGDLHGPGHVEARQDDEAIATGRHVLRRPARRVVAWRSARGVGDRDAHQQAAGAANTSGRRSNTRPQQGRTRARRRRPARCPHPMTRQATAPTRGSCRRPRPATEVPSTLASHGPVAAGDARRGAAPTIRAPPRRTTPRPRSRPSPAPPETGSASA